MARIAIFASGNGSNFEVLADSFNGDINNKIELLICNNEDAFAIDRAKRLGIRYEIVKYEKNRRDEAENKILSILKKNNIDVVFLAGFMKILGEEFLKNAGIPVINIHPSILPKYKGTHAIERAFESDDTEIGITIHYVNEKVDSGEIILQKKISLAREKGLDRVEADVHKLEHKWYPVAAKEICEKLNKSK